MKTIFFALIIAMITGCQTDNNQNVSEKELELKKKELELKEKELELREKELNLGENATEIKESKTENSIIADIREKFATINSNIKSYDRATREAMGESTEGGELVGYFDNDEPQKIVAIYYGETGKSVQEFYFWSSNLFFVFTQTYYYNVPIYMDGSKTESIEENRYYFDNDKLIVWLDPEKKKVPESEFGSVEDDLLQKADELKNEFE